MEMALSAPFLVVLVLGAIDLGRAFFYELPVTSMASQGARLGSDNTSNDIDYVVRTESTVVPNTSAAWGSDLYYSGTSFPGTGTSGTGVDSDCVDTPDSNNHQLCGDPYGCQVSGTYNAFATSSDANGTSSRQACFAVGTCTIDVGSSSAHDGSCTSATTCAWGSTHKIGNICWQTRPAAGSVGASGYANATLVVKVVYLFQPVTPLVGNFFVSSGHVLYLQQTSYIFEDY